MTRRAAAASVLMALSLTTALMGQGCVLPDRDIIIEDEQISNKQPVRFAEPTMLSEEADFACFGDDEEGCPQPSLDPGDALPHFLDPNYIPPGSQTRRYDFCACDPGERDIGALRPFSLYIEDRDEIPRDRTPKDRIFAALQLDLDPASDEPYLALAYNKYLDPSQPLGFADIDYVPLRRPNPHLRELSLDDGTPYVDLCNLARTEPLAPGYHALRIIVSDRAWFQRTAANGQKIAQPGVPDLAAGATFDTVTYVFHCDQKRLDDKNTPYNEGHCLEQCVNLDEEEL